MFEKEAIIHAFEETIGIECLNKPVEDFTYEELSDELQEKAYDFKKGAEFGYNKANEWHYVKDGDLPNTELGMADVTVAYINVYENLCRRDCCFDGINFVYWDDRNLAGWKNVSTFGKIYAWKYLEKLPETPKEDKK